MYEDVLSERFLRFLFLVTFINPQQAHEAWAYLSQLIRFLGKLLLRKRETLIFDVLGNPGKDEINAEFTIKKVWKTLNEVASA